MSVHIENTHKTINYIINPCELSNTGVTRIKLAIQVCLLLSGQRSTLDIVTLYAISRSIASRYFESV